MVSQQVHHWSLILIRPLVDSSQANPDPPQKNFMGIFLVFFWSFFEEIFETFKGVFLGDFLVSRGFFFWSFFGHFQSFSEGFF